MATIKDVAKTAGVSIGTVSNVLHNRSCVSPEAKKKVMDAIELHHYQLNLNASNLKSRKSTSIGLILTRIDSLFFPQVIRGIQQIAEPAGYTISFLISNGNPELEKQHLRTLLGSNMAGILLDSVVDDSQTEYFEELRRISRQQLPVVMLERCTAQWGLDCVYPDNRKGGLLAAGHLIQQKAKRILHISAPSGYPWGVERKNGYMQAVAEAGLIPLLEEGDFSALSGYQIVCRLLENKTPFDGIFAANDMMALGAVKALMEHQLAVPNDIPVIGFDDILVSSLMTPALSSIRIPMEKIGAEAARLILTRIAEQPGSPVSLELPVSLVIRTTSDADSTSEWELF